jgi:hypothetical protein
VSRKHRPKSGDRLSPFVPLLIETIDSLAWRATSHGSKALYIGLRRRYNAKNFNNGRIFLSQRQAREELASGFTAITRWYRELTFYGLIVQTTAGSLGADGRGTAPHWRLTELGYRTPDGRLEPPTRDFMHWDGTPFRDRPKTESRSRNRERTAPETGSTTPPETGSTNGAKRSRNREHVSENPAPETGSVSRYTTLEHQSDAPTTLSNSHPSPRPVSAGRQIDIEEVIAAKSSTVPIRLPWRTPTYDDITVVECSVAPVRSEGLTMVTPDGKVVPSRSEGASPLSDER